MKRFTQREKPRYKLTLVSLLRGTERYSKFVYLPCNAQGRPLVGYEKIRWNVPANSCVMYGG